MATVALQYVSDKLSDLFAELVPARHSIDGLLQPMALSELTTNERATLVRIRIDLEAAWKYVAAVQVRVKGRLEL